MGNISTVQTNQKFLQSLDEEGILLSDYLLMLVEKELLAQGLMKTKSAKNLLASL